MSSFTPSSSRTPPPSRAQSRSCQARKRRVLVNFKSQMVSNLGYTRAITIKILICFINVVHRFTLSLYFSWFSPYFQFYSFSDSYIFKISSAVIDFSLWTFSCSFLEVFHQVQLYTLYIYRENPLDNQLTLWGTKNQFKIANIAWDFWI